MYYVTTGKWTDDQHLVLRRDAARKDVEDLGLFRKTIFDCIDAERLQRLYRESQNAVSAEILFSQNTVIPAIPGVEQAYLGLLRASEYLKLIENETDEILTAIFYDNVRHWQEWNTVNDEMRATLSNADTRILFPLLNNGVTIVAGKITPTAHRFLIEDYQIVNGCQTSYVIHECRELLDDKTMVPVRLIATRDEVIKNSIIKATNRQTTVSDEQLFALTDFPKKLEAFFPTYEGKRKLYYERRSRQYSNVTGIEKVRIVNMAMLVRAFASMFHRQPHRTTRNYKALLKQIGSDIFNKEHRMEPYYVAAYAHCRLEYLFRNQTIDSALKPARYHLLLAFKMLVQPIDQPLMNSRQMEKYCYSICDVLWDDDKCKDTFLEAVYHVLAIAQGNLHRDNIRTEPFTSALISRLTSSQM